MPSGKLEYSCLDFNLDSVNLDRIMEIQHQCPEYIYHLYCLYIQNHAIWRPLVNTSEWSKKMNSSNNTIMCICFHYSMHSLGISKSLDFLCIYNSQVVDYIQRLGIYVILLSSKQDCPDPSFKSRRSDSSQPHVYVYMCLCISVCVHMYI